MKIIINIKDCGESAGTVGDLVRGLESGKYRFEEKRHASDGAVGLWLVSDNGKLNQNVAGFNLPGFNPFRYQLGECFEFDKRDIWTDSAWETIRKVALQWTRNKNAEIDSEKPANLHLLEIKKEKSS